MGSQEVDPTDPVEQLLQEGQVARPDQVFLLQHFKEGLGLLDGFQLPPGDMLQAEEFKSSQFIFDQTLRNFKKQLEEVCTHFTSGLESKHKQQLISFVSKTSATT